MPGLLLSGPAGRGQVRKGAGDSGQSHPPRTWWWTFKALLAALLLLERDESGRYPERTPEHNRLLPLVEFSRRNIIRRAQEAELYTVVTNSATARRPVACELLALLGTDAAEEVIDPGLDVVTRRLSSVDGRLLGAMRAGG